MAKNERQLAVQRLVEEWGQGICDHPNFEDLVANEMKTKTKKSKTVRVTVDTK